jgi:DNA polymerase/3'-5' exonuclease PolX
MRYTAKKMGYKLSEYGLFKKTKTGYEKIHVSSEKEIFNTLGLEYLSPEKRL